MCSHNIPISVDMSVLILINFFIVSVLTIASYCGNTKRKDKSPDLVLISLKVSKFLGKWGHWFGLSKLIFVFSP